MTVLELARLVNEMRNAQRSYFQARSKAALAAARALEGQVDDAVRRVLTRPFQPGLFDRAEGEEATHA